MRASRNLGILALTSAALISSAVIRIGNGVGQAHALMATEPSIESCRDVLPDVLSKLREREISASHRDRELIQKESELVELEQQSINRIRELESIEKRVAALIATSSVAAEEDLKKLTSVYEAMKPRDAASLFAAMAPDFAAGFLGRMNPDHAAAIMSGLSSESAYLISAHLAGRNALAEK